MLGNARRIARPTFARGPYGIPSRSQIAHSSRRARMGSRREARRAGP